MKVALDSKFVGEFFQLEELKEAQQFAGQTGGTVYPWKTTGSLNWLEKRVSIVDVLGIIVIPQGLPDWIDLPDDKFERQSE